MERVTLLVDFSNILHKAIFINQHLSFQSKFTGGLYGFVSQLSKAIVEHSVSSVVVCCDRPPYKRKKIYSDYKGNRKQKDDEFIRLLEQSRVYCLEFLKKMGIPIWRSPGYEADDLLFLAAQNIVSKNDWVIIMSSDTDLYQILCLEPRKHIFFYRNKKQRDKIPLYGIADFRHDYGISPKRWARVIALMGSHNGVPGISGIGLKRALVLVKDKTRYNTVYAENKILIDRNLDLIRLPIEPLPVPDFSALHTTYAREPKVRYRAGTNYLISKGIKITGRMQEAFMMLQPQLQL